MPAVGLVYCEECDAHALRDGFGKERDHCERPERTQAVWDKLNKNGLADQCLVVPAREASRSEALARLYALLASSMSG